MRLAQMRVWPWLLGGLLLASAGGCALVADLFAEGLAADLGLDPATVKPQQGTILVAFVNNTRYTATFYAYKTSDATDLTSGAKNFSAEVTAGEVQNEVLDCPIGLVSPGTLGTDFSIDATAATLSDVADGEAAVATVAYEGTPLVSGSTFACGDVIEIRLSQVTVGDEQEFLLSVRVIPGN